MALKRTRGPRGVGKAPLKNPRKTYTAGKKPSVYTKRKR